MTDKRKLVQSKMWAGLTIGIVGLVLALLMAGWGVQAQGIALPTPTPTLPAPADLPEYGVLVQQCGDGVSPRGPDFAANGFIITTFSRDALWVIDVARGARYPLPDTRPCSASCRPSPDRTRLLYVSPETATYWTMRPDGFERVSVFPYYVSELNWWDADHWLAWPTAGLPAIYPMDVPPTEAEPLRLTDYDVYSIQPGGFHGLRLANSSGEWPVLELVDLADGSAVPLVEVQPYFGATYWSPDGSSLAYIGQGEFDPGVGLRGAEVFVITPGQSTARRITNLTGLYGASRLTGASAAHALSWSPDGRFLAFWVLEIIGPDMAANVGQAVMHVLDTQTGKLTAYCGFATNNHDPVLPEPVWSPDGQYIAFGVDEPGDERPALLLVLDTVTGDFTEVSEGMVAAYGTYDPVMWGVVP